MAEQQHAEFVDAVDDLMLVQDVILLLHLAAGAEHFMQRQHRVVGGVIGVMAGRTIDRLAPVIAHGVIVGDRDRLVMGDQKTVLRAGRRRPAAHAGVGARLQQIDRRAAAEFMTAAIVRHPGLMRAPAEFGRLHAFRHKAFDRPGVDEVPRGLGSLARWVSRSAIWTPLIPRRWASAAHSSRVLGSGALSSRSAARLTKACFTNHDTMPGLAPQVEIAVVPPGFFRFVPARSRAAHSWSAFPVRDSCRNRSRATAR